jgi:hypothetical protein
LDLVTKSLSVPFVWRLDELLEHKVYEYRFPLIVIDLFGLHPTGFTPFWGTFARLLLLLPLSRQAAAVGKCRADYGALSALSIFRFDLKDM